MRPDTKTKVIIIGGGFGGAYAAQYLENTPGVPASIYISSTATTILHFTRFWLKRERDTWNRATRWFLFGAF
jgi:cation diffusion facilitator CzcD-associated flavoprotein CzcO